MLWKNVKVFLIVFALLIALPLSLAEENESSEELYDDLEDELYDEEDDLLDDEDEVVDDSDDAVSEEDELINEDNKVVSEDTELAPFRTNHGASVRLLQLERSIQKNIIQGELLLNRLADRLDNESLEELEAILMAMEDLKLSVSEYELQGNEEDVRAFVNFRHEASMLTKEFRETLRTFVRESERNNLRNRVIEESRASPALARMNNLLRERAREHNEKVVRDSVEDSGVIDENLLRRIRSGEIESREIREEVLRSVRADRAEQAQDVLRDMREEALRRRMNLREESEKLRAEVREANAEVREERMRERINEVRDRLPEELNKRVRERVVPAVNQSNLDDVNDTVRRVESNTERR